MARKIRNSLGLAALLVGTGVAVRAEVVMQENFEGNGSSCGVRDSYTEVYQVVTDGSNPHSGRCSGYHHFARDEDAAYLRHRGPTASSKVLHGVYWVYYSGSGTWPRHQKMNRFYIGTAENSGPEYVGILHPFGNGGTRMSYTSDIPEPVVGNRDCRLQDGPGCSCTVFDLNGAFPVDQWHSVEFYVEMRGGALPGVCTNANDILRVWLDGTLVIDRNNVNLSNGHPSYSFQNFWVFGNSSAGQGQCDGSGGCKTVYFDDICIATSANECGGQASGGGPDPGAPPNVENVRRTDTHP